MAFDQSTNAGERKPRSKDKNGREYEEYQGKRSTVVGVVSALVYDKKDGTRGRAAKSEVFLGDLRIIIIPANAGAFKVIVERITAEGVEAPK